MFHTLNPFIFRLRPSLIADLRRLTLMAFIVLVGMLANMQAEAQELNARVNVNHQQIQGTSTSVFETLQNSLTQLINEKQWTNLQFKPQERISCTFNITVKKYKQDDNSFECTLMVQASRPVYNSSYTTTTFSFSDPDFNFNYQEYDQLEFRPDVIDNNLTAVIGYYVYLIIGFDLDSMSPLGGTEEFRTAQTITTNAQGLQAKGWKAFDSSKNRYAIITDLLDSGMEVFRKMQYTYYRQGLDVMSENAERGRTGITDAMSMLRQAKDNKSLSMLPQIFTEYKRDELLSIYKGHGAAKEKAEIVETLSRINASQSSYWRQMAN